MRSPLVSSTRPWRLRATAAVATIAASTALAVPAASAAPTAAPAQVSAVSATELPTGLKVNGLDRPADLEDLASPAFSWQLVSLPRQSAYRIVVSSTKAQADAHTGDVWDSGKVTSAQQTDVAYAGPALESSHRYYWSVQVWDGAGTTTGFAEPSWFGTSPGSTWADATPIWAPSPTTTGWADYTMTAKITVSAVALGLRFRAVDANNSYMWQFRGSDNRLVPHKQTAGAYATLGSAVNLPAGTLAVGRPATVAITVSGSTITTTIDGVQVDQRTDASFASGLVGVRTGSTESGTVDDLSVVSAAGATLVSDDMSGANPFACGSVSGGVATIPTGSNCLLSGFGNDWVMARKDVQLQDKPIAWASLFATGTEWKASKQYVYKASIDGTFVGLGPTAPVGAETRFDGFDVTSLLTPGKTSTISVVAHSTSSDAKLLARLEVQYADGTRQVVGTGSDWKVLAAGKVFPSSGSYGTSYFSAPREDLDARVFPVGYDRPGFDDSSWVDAQERSTIADLQAAPMAKVDEQLRSAAKITEKAPGDYVVDFGRTWLGGISWDVAAGTAGAKAEVRFGQVLNADGTVKYKTAATNNYLDSMTMRAGAQHLETWGLRTFRYVEIVNAPEPVTTDSLKALAVVYPFDEEASAFASSDEDLDQVYALSKNTIEATNQNFYTDSWERERTNYEADAYLQLMSSLYLMDDLSLGRYSMNYFKANRTWPTEWPVYVVLAVHDAWRQTGNTEQVADYYDNLKTKLPTEKWLNQATGLVGKATGSNGDNSKTDYDIVDWPASERDGYAFRYHNTVINSIAYQALVDMSDMAAAIGKDAEAATYAEQAAALRDAINTKLYDPATGAYDDGADVNGVLTGHHAVQASAFALAFGVPEASERAEVADFVSSRGMVCSVYCAAFLIKGLYDGGNGQAALDLLTDDGMRSWVNMIKAGAGATMEAWDLSLKPNTSYSHPWAASPAFNIPSGLFGIQPLTAGYEKVAIKPAPGDLTWGTIKTPTVRGSVGAAFAQDASGTTVVASVPGNTSGTVSVPTTATSATVLYVDGVARRLEPTGGYVAVDLGAGCHVLSPTEEVADLARLTSVCATEPVTSAPAATTAPTVSGTARYGEVLTATAGTWDADVTTSFQWLRDGDVIAGATAPTYLIGAADVGKRLSVRVTAVSGRRPAGESTSAATAAVQRAASTTDVTLGKKVVRDGHKVRALITVGGGHSTATGTVRIRREGWPAVVKNLKNGTFRLRFRAHGTGRSEITVRYSGSAVLERGAKVTVSYRIR